MNNHDSVCDYISECRRIQVSTRVLLCCSQRNSPNTANTIDNQYFENARYLGYDYAYSSGEFSALYSDMNPPANSHFETFVSTLNEYGLMANIKDIFAYEKYRSHLTRSILDEINAHPAKLQESIIEVSGDFLILQLWEVDSDWLKDNSRR